MLKKIVIFLIVLVAVILGFAATGPDTFRIQRAIEIKAAPDRIFTLINDLHRWGSWSPFEKIDPAMKRTFSGAVSGKGAVYAWEGNRSIGKGRMEITESTPPARIVIKLDFIEPMTAHNTAEFTIVPKGGSTTVTWAMYGPNNYLAKVIHLFFSMDRMVGKDFEAGLRSLKTIAEK